MGKLLRLKSEDELPVAKWYRGLSLDQIQAVDDLAVALSIDRPTPRDCLLRLGVRPLVNNQQLLRIVQVSRAQNLAFLFFLFQEHYRPKGPCDSYSYNGQLLLSAIAHLDLPATFQALDKVLPLNGKGKSRSQGAKAKTQSGGNGTLHWQRHLTHSSIRRSLKMRASPPQTSDQHNDMEAAFRALDKVLRAGSHRNSATPTRDRCCRTVKRSPYFQKQPRPKSDLQSSRHVANPPLFKVQIPEMESSNSVDGRWFADFQFHPIERTVKAVINYELSHLFDTIDEAPSDPVLNPRELCEFHQENRFEERQKFLREQRRRYLDMLDIEAAEKRLTKARIIHHLNRDVDEYLRKFGDMARSYGVPVLRKAGCAACSELIHVHLEPPPQVLLLEGQWGRLYDRSGPMMRLCGGQDNRPPSLNNKRPSLDKKKPSQDIPVTGYFKAPKLHRPYILNYDRIFGMERQESLETNEMITSAIKKALSDDENYNSESEVRYSRRTRKRSHINASISRCVRKIFEKSVLVAQMQRTPRTSNDRLSYGNRTRFDPDDEKLMDQMLSDAFQVLRKDRKLVLVTLPDGHQLPELREWIRLRYGKRYGPQTIDEVDKMRANIRKLPDIEKKLGPLLAHIDAGLTNKDTVSFALFKGIIEKANRSKKSFRDRFFLEVLEQTRQCWNTQHILRTYNSRGLNRIFFTYLPNRIRDVGPTISPFVSRETGIK